MEELLLRFFIVIDNINHTYQTNVTGTKNINFLMFMIFSFMLLSSIFQFYFIQVIGSYFSLTTFSILLLSPFVIKNINLLTWKPLFLLVLLIIFQILSYFWSSDLKLGLRSVLGFLLFLIVVISSYEITNRYPKKVLFIFLLYFILLVIPIFLVILFRINPSIELAFLHSDIARLFINPNTINGLFDGARNNVLDPEKAGGFFVNGNVAAAFLGINALISYGFAKAYSIKWLKVITLLLILGVIFTGSKAGLILIILLMSFAIILTYFIKNSLTLQKIVISLFFFNLIYFIFLFIGYQFLHSNFTENVIKTTDIRFLIWYYGLSEFFKHPIIGLGFGGWQNGFAKYAIVQGIDTGYPPHNTFLYLWSQSGIFVVIFAIFFIIYILKFGFLLINTLNKELKGLGIAVLGAFLWIFIHGMGTNFGLVGELHMEVILASLLGYSLSRFKSYSKGIYSEE